MKQILQRYRTKAKEGGGQKFFLLLTPYLLSLVLFLIWPSAGAEAATIMAFTSGDQSLTVPVGATKASLWWINIDKNGIMIGPTFTALRLQQSGTVAHTLVTRVYLYADSAEDGGDESLTYTASDVSLTSGTFDAAGQLTLSGFTSSWEVNGSHMYFVLADVSVSAPATQTIQLSMNATTWFTTSALENGTFPQTTVQITITSADRLTLSAATTAPANLTQSTQDDFLRLTLKTDGGEVQLTTLNVSLIGSAVIGDVAWVKLYKDGTTGADGDGVWQTTDVSLMRAAFPANKLATLSGLNETLTTTAKKYFLVVEAASAATALNTVGLTIKTSSMVTVSGAVDTVSSADLSTGIVTTFQAPIISGTVTDTSGSPLSGVTLTISGGSTTSTTSAADGTYSVTLSSGLNYTLTAVKAGLIFSPGRRFYIPLSADQTVQNFTGAVSNGWGASVSWGMAVDGEGNAYTVLYSASQLIKFDANGATMATWTTHGAPTGVAVGPDGSVYVSSFTADDVVKYTSTGVSLAQWGGLNNPYGMGIDPAGNVYVANYSATPSEVRKYDANGVPGTPASWAMTGTGPLDVEVDQSGNVYVACYGSHAVQKFSTTGTSLWGWGGTGKLDGQLTNPYGVGVDGVGNVYVTDTGNNRVQKFSPTGTFLTSWGYGSGAQLGQWNSPRGVAVGVSGKLFVADSTNNRIQTWNQGFSTYSIAGTVRDGAGLGVSGVTLHATAWPLQALTTTASDGTFSLPGLMGGTWTLWASQGGQTFVTTNYAYAPLSSNQTNQDFTAIQRVTMTAAVTAPLNLTQGNSTDLLRLTLKTDVNNSRLIRLDVSLIGTATASDLASVKLYRDTGDGVWQAGDTLLASATFDSISRWATLNGISQTLSTTNTTLFMVVEAGSGATPDRIIGLTLPDASNVGLALATDTVAGVFPMGSGAATTLVAEATEDQVTVTATSTAPGNLGQSAIDDVLALTLQMNANTATLTQLRFSLTDNPGIAAVYLYRDSATVGWQVTDTPLGTLTSFTDNLGTFTGLTQGLTTSQTTLYLVVSLNATATPNAVFALTLLNSTYLTLASPDTVTITNGAVGSAAVSVTDTPDMATLEGYDNAPTSLSQGSGAVFLHLTLSTTDSVTLNLLKFSLTDTTGVSAVKLYRELATDGFDFGDTTLGIPVTTFGVDRLGTFSGLTDVISTGVPATYYLVVSLSVMAPTGTISITLLDTTFLTLASPDTVNNLMVGSKLVTITDTPDTGTLTPYDSAPTNLGQGSGAAFLQLTLATTDSVTLNLIKFSLTDPTGVSAVKLYRELATNGFDLGDTPLGSAVTTFAGNAGTFSGLSNVVATGAPATYYLVVSLNATAPTGTLGITLLDPTFLTLASPDTISSLAAGSKLVTITDAPDTVTVTSVTLNPPTLGQGTGANVLRLTLVTTADTATLNQLRFSLTANPGVTAVALYQGATWKGSVTSFTDDRLGTIGGLAEDLTTTPKTYTVALTLSTTATPGQSVSVTLLNATFLTLANPDTVNTFAAGSGTVQVTDTPDTVTVTGRNVAPTEVQQGDTQALVHLTFSVNQDAAVFTSLKVWVTGNLLTTQLDAVKLYRDGNGDGTWQANLDVPVSTLSTFDGNRLGTLKNFSETITTTPAVYFLTVTPSAVGTIGNTIGLTLSDYTYLTVLTPDTKADFAIGSTTASLVSGANEVSLAAWASAPTTLGQGSAASFLHLTMKTNFGNATVAQLRISLTQTSGVAAVRLYRETNTAGWSADDTLVGTPVTVFGADQRATFGSLTEPLTTSPKTYYLVVSLSATAAPDQTLGLSLTTSDVAVNAPGAMGAFVATHPPVMVTDTPDTLAVIGADLAPASTASGIQQVFLRLTMVTNQDQTILNRLALSLVGTQPVGEVTARLLRASDGGLVGSTGFDTNRLGTFSGFTETLGTTPITYTVALSIATGASDGSVGVTLSNGFLGLATPDLVGAVSGGSLVITVIGSADGVTVSGGSAGAVSLTQGASGALLKFTLVTASKTALVTQVRVSLTGSVAASSVTALRLYRDNGDGTWSSSADSLLGSTASFVARDATFPGLSEGVTTAPTAYFVVATLDTLAAVGDTVGVAMTSSGLITVADPDFVGAVSADSGLVSVVDAPDVLRVTAASSSPLTLTQGASAAFLTLTLSSDQDRVTFSALRVSLTGTLSPTFAQVFLTRDGTVIGQAGFNADRLASLNNLMETITASPGTYALAVSLAPGATVGTTVGVTMSGASFFTVADPDTVGAMSFGSGLVTVADLPEVLRVSAGSIAPASMAPGDQAGVFALTLVTDAETVTLRILTVALTATPQAAGTLFLVDAAGQTLGSIPLAASQVVLTLTTPLVVSTTPVLLTLGVVVSPQAVPGDLLHLMISELASWGVDAPAGVEGSGFPLVSGVITVVANAINPPEKPFGVLTAFVGSRFQLSWEPVVKKADGTVLDNFLEYRIYRSSSRGGPWLARVTLTGIAWTEDESVTQGQAWYYVIRAVNTYQQEGESSLIVAADGYAFTQDPTQEVSVKIPVEMLQEMREEGNTAGEYLHVKLEMTEGEPLRGVVREYTIQLTKSDGTKVNLSNFSRRVELLFRVDVALGAIRRAAPAAAVGLSGEISAYDVFWHDGVTWVKMNARANAADQSLTVTSAHVGRYRVKQSLRATEFIVTQLSPSKTFTPNGDGVNDVMTIFFENPKDSVVTSAKVFDLYGAEVADLKLGSALNSYEWDGNNKSGTRVARGVYVYQLLVEGKVLTGTIAVAR